MVEHFAIVGGFNAFITWHCPPFSNRLQIASNRKDDGITLNMNEKIPLSSITVTGRFREAYNGIPELASEIKSVGLIQPLVLVRNSEGNLQLAAGGRRYKALTLLGVTELEHGITSTPGKYGYVFREEVPLDALLEIELKENFNRENFTWQEECIAIAKIHVLKTQQNARDSKSWGQRETGRLLNVNQATVSYSLIVARELLKDPTKSNDFWKASNFNEAYNLLMKSQEDEALARLAAQQTTAVAFPAPSPDDDELDTSNNPFFTPAPVEPLPEILGYRHVLPPIEDREPCKLCGTSPNPDCEHCLGEGFQWKNKEGDNGIQVEPIYSDAIDQKSLITKEVEIPLYRRYIKGDSISLMNSPEWAGRFDHIITDIPFGIDIDMIDQSNSIKNITDIKAEHTVEGNLELHTQFFKASYNCLKDSGFCITWLDIMQWQRMYDLAVDAGFKVTRWPFVWVKSYPCLNQMAQYNMTKSVEFAMICRKGVITLPEKQTTCHILTGKDDLCEGHPFAKPFDCWERLITAVSIENQLILDPFCGSGSCFKSGVRLGRMMFGVEKDEALYNSGLESLKQFYLNLNPKAIFV